MENNIPDTDKQHKLDIILKEYETLRNEIIANGNRNIQIICLLLTIYSVGLGYAIQNKIGDIFLLLPLVTFPLLIFYIRDQISLGAIGKYIEKEIEKKKIPSIIKKTVGNSSINLME